MCTRCFEIQSSPGCTCTRRSKFLTHSLTTYRKVKELRKSYFLCPLLFSISTRLVILCLFIFLIYFPELSSEIKALDLRLSDTLLHNLIKIGDLVAPQSDALRIMSMVMKDVSPKWRMMFIRKLFQAENVNYH